MTKPLTVTSPNSIKFLYPSEWKNERYNMLEMVPEIFKLEYINSQLRRCSASAGETALSSYNNNNNNNNNDTTTDEIDQSSSTLLPSKLFQRRRASLQYTYQYTRRTSLPRHSIFLCSIDSEEEPPKSLISSSATPPSSSAYDSSTSLLLPSTPTIGPVNTSKAKPTTTTTTANAIFYNNNNNNNNNNSNLSPVNSQFRRTLLIPKSPTSPTILKRPYFYHSSINNSSNHLRVLLVDDNDINLQILARVLNTHMANVFRYMDLVESGEKAIEKLQQHIYDLILMDIDMPNLNGIDTACFIRNGQKQKIKNNNNQGSSLSPVLYQNRHVPIVAVTTNISLEWKKTYLKVGMNGCLAKPVSPFVLRNSLTQVLMYGSHWDYNS